MDAPQPGRPGSRERGPRGLGLSEGSFQAQVELSRYVVPLQQVRIRPRDRELGISVLLLFLSGNDFLLHFLL